MVFSRVSKVLMTPMTRALTQLTGGVPRTNEPKAMRPEQRAEIIARRAAGQVAALTASTLNPDELEAMFDYVPNLISAWRIQAQMVADIASAFGRKEPISHEELTACLMTHLTKTAVREYSKNRPIAHPCDALTLTDLVQRASEKGVQLRGKVLQHIGQAVLERAIDNALSKLAPLAGTAVACANSLFDTEAVARTAVEFFSGQKEAPKPRRIQQN